MLWNSGGGTLPTFNQLFDAILVSRILNIFTGSQIFRGFLVIRNVGGTSVINLMELWFQMP